MEAEEEPVGVDVPVETDEEPVDVGAEDEPAELEAEVEIPEVEIDVDGEIVEEDVTIPDELNVEIVELVMPEDELAEVPVLRLEAVEVGKL